MPGPSPATLVALYALLEVAFADPSGSFVSKLPNETIRDLDQCGCLDQALECLTGSTASPDVKVGAAQFIARIMACRADDRRLQRTLLQRCIADLQALEATL